MNLQHQLVEKILQMPAKERFMISLHMLLEVAKLKGWTWDQAEQLAREFISGYNATREQTQALLESSRDWWNDNPYKAEKTQPYMSLSQFVELGEKVMKEEGV